MIALHLAPLLFIILARESSVQTQLVGIAIMIAGASVFISGIIDLLHWRTHTYDDEIAEARRESLKKAASIRPGLLVVYLIVLILVAVV
jgi:hypothetical protein